ncbi:MAG: hypothetical protein HKN16_09960, partial [Saprospiraceae bacterium]|nr:hypothetical protein [Saprospiraceae bacterium]
SDHAGLSYSLVHVNPGKESRVFPFKKNESSSLSVDKDYLIPDPSSGFLKVRYQLDEPSDVNIRLLQKSKNGRALMTSRYQNQRKGKYLKSINMNDYPHGSYHLVIQVNEEVLQEFEIQK